MGETTLFNIDEQLLMEIVKDHLTTQGFGQLFITTSPSTAEERIKTLLTELAKQKWDQTALNQAIEKLVSLELSQPETFSPNRETGQTNTAYYPKGFYLVSQVLLGLGKANPDLFFIAQANNPQKFVFTSFLKEILTIPHIQYALTSQDTYASSWEKLLKTYNPLLGAEDIPYGQLLTQLHQQRKDKLASVLEGTQASSVFDPAFIKLALSGGDAQSVKKVLKEEGKQDPTIIVAAINDPQNHIGGLTQRKLLLALFKFLNNEKTLPGYTTNLEVPEDSLKTLIALQKATCDANQKATLLSFGMYVGGVSFGLEVATAVIGLLTNLLDKHANLSVEDQYNVVAGLSVFSLVCFGYFIGFFIRTSHFPALFRKFSEEAHHRVLKMEEHHAHTPSSVKNKIYTGVAVEATLSAIGFLGGSFFLLELICYNLYHQHEAFEETGAFEFLATTLKHASETETIIFAALTAGLLMGTVAVWFSMYYGTKMLDAQEAIENQSEVIDKQRLAQEFDAFEGEKNPTVKRYTVAKPTFFSELFPAANDPIPLSTLSPA